MYMTAGQRMLVDVPCQPSLHCLLISVSDSVGVVVRGRQHESPDQGIPVLSQSIKHPKFSSW